MGAYDFPDSGTVNHIKSSNSTDLLSSSHTYHIFAKFDDSTNAGYIFMVEASAGTPFNIIFSHRGTNNLMLEIGYSTSGITLQADDSFLDTTNWFHIFYTWPSSITATNSHIYKCTNQGTLTEATYQTATDGSGTLLAADGEVHIGGRDTATTREMNGKAQDSAYWTRVLTSDEMQSICDGLQPNKITNGLLAYLSMTRNLIDNEASLPWALTGTPTVTANNARRGGAY